MNCVACGSTLSPGNRFCPGCGAPAPIPAAGTATAAEGAAPSDVPREPMSAKKLRDSLSKFADKIVASMKSGDAAAENPFFGALSRFIQGALMHREIYSTAARRKDLTIEAWCILGAIFLAEALGATWVLRSALGTAQLEWIAIGAGIRLASLACGVLALRFFANAIHRVDLNVLGWGRALVYAQAATVLGIIGQLGTLAWIWAAACIVAAIRDLTRKSVADAVILLLIVWAPYSIAQTLMAKFLVGRI